MRNWRPLVLVAALLIVPLSTLPAEERTAPGDRPQRVLLLGQGPDGHPWSTHEYMAGLKILAGTLDRVEGLQPIIVKADEPWTEGPELIDSADGLVLSLAEGAKWLQQDPERLAAFQRLAQRGGGLAVIHWGMGTKDAKYIDAFVKLFGGVHGGPDRKYAIVEVRAEPADAQHPVLRGIEPFTVHDEFYYRLKFAQPAIPITPLLRVPIDGESHAVAWAWERPDGGRSFGFSGAHFHRNWQLEPYRRLAAQGVLWTLRVPIPEDGLPVDVTQQDLELPPRAAEKR